MNYRIVPCRMAHLRDLLPRLRVEEREEIAAIGQLPRHFAHVLWVNSQYSRAAVCDRGTICAWGDSAPVLSWSGHMWLLTTDLIEQFPLSFFREARKEIASRLDVRISLRTSILATSDRSLRFYRLLGFEADAELMGAFRNLRISRPDEALAA